MTALMISPGKGPMNFLSLNRFGLEVSARLGRSIALVLALALLFPLSARAELLRLAHASTGIGRIQVNNAGEVLWESDGQIYLWSGGVVRQLTQGHATRVDWSLG